MIKDVLNKKIIKGLNYLISTDFETMQDGRHVINEDMYVNIQTYQTKQEALFEAHRKYIDIQYIIEGKEQIGVTEYSNCTEVVPYDKENDIEFLTGEGDFHILNKGEYMILYPSDAHKPSITHIAQSTVRKAVLKIKV